MSFVQHRWLRYYRLNYEPGNRNRSTTMIIEEFDVRVHDTRKPDESSVVRVSRRGVAAARIVTTTDEEVLTIHITTSVDFDIASDYIVVDYSPKPREGRVDPRRESNLLVGRCPGWMAWGPAYKAWVENPDVEESAVQYILLHCPEVATDIAYARAQTARTNRIHAWERVITDINTLMPLKLGKPFAFRLSDNTDSVTKSRSIPHRLAKFFSNQLKDELPWVPPIEKPPYEDPWTSGAVVLANRNGVYPESGPGIDDRPVTRDPFHFR